MKIHFVGLAVIILLVIAIAYKTTQPGPQMANPYVIEIVNATFGQNCNAQILKDAPSPYADMSAKAVQKNNVLGKISQLCNGKNTCQFSVDRSMLDPVASQSCNQKLSIDYRCFSYDRPWHADAAEGEKISIDCSTRGG